MIIKSLDKKTKDKTYPYSWLQSKSRQAYPQNLYLTLIYLLIICLLVTGVHFIILSNGLSKNGKFLLSLPFPIIIIFLLIVNKRYISLAVTAIIGFLIIIFASFHFYLTSQYPGIFSEICKFENKESFMFIPFWMLNLYLVAFPSILIIYEILDYYLVSSKNEIKELKNESLRKSNTR